MSLLQQRGAPFELVEYLKAPLDAAALSTLLDQLQIDAHDLLRPKEAPYQELGLSQDSTRDEIIAAIAAQPVLMERPIIINGDRAVIGRPPERLLELLQG